MPAIEFQGSHFAAEPGETVLATLLRNGVPATHSCLAGSCGSCMMRAVTGTLPEASQTGLKDSWKAQRYFLPCVCVPQSDLSLAPVGADAQTPATIADIQPLGAEVMRVRIVLDAPIEGRAGQNITILRDRDLARSYSIASITAGNELELHVRRIPGGKMSCWLHNTACSGARIQILGPSGDCFYVPGNRDQPLLLVGTGTGLAPLYGILNDALRYHHRGPIHLVHGAVHTAGLYLVEELRGIANTHANFEYVPTVLNEAGPIDQVVLHRYPNLKGWRAWICGDPAVVQTLKKKLFLRGVASKDIYADAFLPSPQG